MRRSLKRLMNVALCLAVAACWLRAWEAADDDLEKADLLIKQKQYTDAVSLLERLGKPGESTKVARICNELAICYLELGDLKRAGASLEASLAAVPGNANATYLKGFLLFRLEHYFESRELISNYLRVNPSSIGAHKILGMDEYMLQDYSAALEDLRRATEMAPSDSESFYYLGRLYFSTDKADAAREAFLKAIDRDSTNAKAWNHLGQSFEALNREKDAERAYMQSMEAAKLRHEEYEWPAFNLGVLYSNTGRARDGTEYLRKALAIKPDWVECKVKLGAALFAAGDPAGALRLMRSAVASDPRNAEAHYRLAMMLTKAGYADEAKQHLAVFQELQRQSVTNKGMAH